MRYVQEGVLIEKLLPRSEHLNRKRRRIKATNSHFENRPRTRQRKFKPPSTLEIPAIEEDAAERKRVLNILAQRRYRQRKRQLRQGSAATHPGDNGDPGLHGGTIPIPARESHLLNNGTSETAADLITDAPVTNLQEMDFDTFLQAVESLPINMSSFMTEAPEVGTTSAINSDVHLTFHPSNPLPFGASQVLECSTNTTSPPSLVQSPDSQLALVFSTPSPTKPPTESFPDSYLLPMSELTLLRALLRIATRLNAHTVWDMSANSPFNCDPTSDTDPSWTLTLPLAWQPTAQQRTTPHHPLIDLLPWPAVRDRMISMLYSPKSRTSNNPTTALECDQEGEISLPKPSIIQSSEGNGIPPLVGFIYDMEDGAEGIRIWGGDPYDEHSWEVGQAVFQRWWFLFDRGVVERSNYWRALRGAEGLRMG